jgi:radical SAM protein with 4Fe4S-binding SPASM domain
VLVATGGDVLMRRDLPALLRRAAGLGIPVAAAPSVTPLLTAGRARELRDLGIRAASISLDGATSATHEGVRGVEGHFTETLYAIRLLHEAGIRVQVNTTVMAETVAELPAVAEIVARERVATWELFFLIHVGRGERLGALSPWENEAVCHFLYEASRYGFVVRTVEAPFFRRVTAAREGGEPPLDHPLYAQLAEELRARLGAPTSAASAQTRGTRDGKGIVFVAHDGDVYPAGFLPIALGNVRTQSLTEIYREHPLLLDIRAARFSGSCSACAFAQVCGGSRARAFAATGDPLGDDPGCALAARAAPRLSSRAVTQDVARFYDAISVDYHFLMGPWRDVVPRYGAALDEVLRERLGRPGPFDVLDCSCGIGTQAIGLALQGHRVHATDLSPASVARAAEEAASFGVELTAGVADMRFLSEQVGGEYDAVLSGNTLSHFDHDGLVEVFRSAAGVLRAGGAFLATLRDYDALLAERPRFQAAQVHDTEEGKRIVFQVWDWVGDSDAYVMNYFVLREGDGEFDVSHEQTPLHAHTRAGLAEALEAAGYRDCRWHAPDAGSPAMTILAGNRQ